MVEGNPTLFCTCAGISADNVRNFVKQVCANHCDVIDGLFSATTFHIPFKWPLYSISYNLKASKAPAGGS